MSQDIYQLLTAGDYIDDQELKTAIKDYQAAHDALIKLGPAFEVSRKALCQCLISLESMQQARKEK